jgi:hypothetical protein
MEIHNKVEESHSGSSPFKPTTQIYAAFVALCLIAFTESLDATSIAIVLPVSSTPPSISFMAK